MSSTADSPAAATGRAVATDRRVLLRAFALGLLVAEVLVLLVYGVARAVGDPLRVTVAGQAAQQVPVGAAIFATLIGAVAGLVLAVLARLSRRPRTAFVGIAAVGLLLSFASPAMSASGSTVLWLCVMHVAAFAGIVPPLARVLASRR